MTALGKMLQYVTCKTLVMWYMHKLSYCFSHSNQPDHHTSSNTYRESFFEALKDIQD